MRQYLYRVYETIPGGTFYVERSLTRDGMWKRCGVWCGDRTDVSKASAMFSCSTLEEAKEFVECCRTWAIKDAAPTYRLICEL